MVILIIDKAWNMENFGEKIDYRKSGIKKYKYDYSVYKKEGNLIVVYDNNLDDDYNGHRIKQIIENELINYRFEE